MIFEREARETLTAIEMNRGDELRFTLKGGRAVSMVLEDCSARVLVTNLPDTRREQPGGGTILEMTARVRIDGRPMTMRRYICAQESFCEPYVVNGLRIWFDAVQDLFYHVEETHGPCRPEGHARFAVQDATLPICPGELVPWCGLPGERLNMREAYNGDDCWLGPYRGASAHGGLDINHPAGSPLFAPFDLDDQYYYNSVAAGYVNNRWRGVRRWPDGSIWTIQVCHIVELTVPEHQPLAAGQEFARAAGVWVGDHQHSHFIFKVSARGGEVLLDPWIIFRQIFEGGKAGRGALEADIAPLAPAETGEAVKFSGEGSRAGEGAGFFWTFGDGGAAEGPGAEHVFARAGVYPVTLTVEDGGERASATQHITVDGPRPDRAVLVLEAPDEPSFRKRPAPVADVYGEPPGPAPHTLSFTARSSRPEPAARFVNVANAGGDRLEKPWVTQGPDSDWLTVEPQQYGKGQRLAVKVDAAGLEPGAYSTKVSVDCPGAASSPQVFRVRLTVPGEAPAAEAVVDDRDPGFYATPHFWLAPPFHGWPGKYGAGFGGRYLANGGRPEEGEFARFTPDLAAGRYEVSLHEETPFEKVAAFRREGPMRFRARVRHAEGDDGVWVSPTESRTIGTFRFEEGADGFVEILAAGSAGQVLLDAVRFRKVD